MHLNEAKFNRLTDTQIEAVQSFIESIYVNQEPTVRISLEDDLKHFAIFISLMADLTDQVFALNHLSDSSATAIQPFISPTLVRSIIVEGNSARIAQILFKTLSADHQKKVLGKCFTANRPRYDILAPLLPLVSPKATGVPVTRSTAMSELIDIEVERVLDLIVSDTDGVEDTAIAAKRLKQRMALDELENVAFKLISRFEKLDIAVRDVKSFTQHLKFYFFVDGLHEVIPAITDEISALLEDFCVSMKVFPNDEWRIKVINQLPLSVIRQIWAILSAYETMEALEKREWYCKLLDILKAKIDSPEAENIRFAVTGE